MILDFKSSALYYSTILLCQYQKLVHVFHLPYRRNLNVVFVLKDIIKSKPPHLNNVTCSVFLPSLSDNKIRLLSS